MEQTVGNGTWKLVGTASQISVLLPVFDPQAPSFITFPWDRMRALPHYPVPVSWDNLNDGTLRQTYFLPVGNKVERAALHPHVEDEDGNVGHGISRPTASGRMQIAGVFWSDGRIKLDTSLETRPAVAREVLSAEIAHAVDYGMPLTSLQKDALIKLLHHAGPDAHTWWERQDYGSEYYTLVGEAWMALCTHAYSQMEPWQTPFVHKSTREMAGQVHAILGVYPVTAAKVYSLRGYRTFHRRTHLVSSWLASPKTSGRVNEWADRDAAVTAGLRPCLICKP